MKKLEVTAYDLAQRFVGTAEAPGMASNPLVLAMLRLDQAWPAGDDVAWCSAFLNFVAWLLRLPRSKSLSARSWLQVGTPVALEDAVAGFDVVILQRGTGAQPGAEVLNAPGHVGLFAGFEPGELFTGAASTVRLQGKVLLLGGNQGDQVSIASYPAGRVLGVRRLV